MADRPLAARPLLLRASLALLGAWLLWPALFSQHLEGYTASLEAMALLPDRAAIARQDLLYPVLTEFLYYTRAGVIAALHAIYAVFGNIGDVAFRLLMIGSLAVLLGSSVSIARRMGGVPRWAGFLALLLVPGITECAFFFNDNIPSAALATLGLALVCRSDRPFAYLAAGVLAGLAALARLDSIVLAAPVLGLAWVRHPLRRPLPILARGGCWTVGILAALLAGKLLLDATPLDAVLISRGLLPGPVLATSLRMAWLFFGLPGALLCLAGLVLTARERWRAGEGKAALLWTGYPVVLLLLALRMSSEVRYVFPLLSAFVALLAGRALMALARGVTQRRIAARIGVTLLLLAAVAPPVNTVLDGPHAPWGRLWSPFFWSRWQDLVSHNLRTTDTLVDEAGRVPLLLVIHTHFNDEFFFKERLIQAGFRVEEAGVAFPGCSGFSVYRRGEHVVAQVRTENQYGQAPTYRTRFAALAVARALACPPLRTASSAVVTIYGTNARVPLEYMADPALWEPLWPRFGPPGQLSAAFTARSLAGGTPWRDEARTDATPVRALEGRLRAYPLSRAELDAMAASADRYLRRPIGPRPDGAITPALVSATFAGRCRPLGSGMPFSLAPRCCRPPTNVPDYSTSKFKVGTRVLDALDQAQRRIFGEGGC